MTVHRDRELRIRIPLVLSGTAAVTVGLLLAASRLPLHHAERPLSTPVEIEAGLVELPSLPTAATPTPAPSPVAPLKPEVTPLPRLKPLPQHAAPTPPAVHPQSISEAPTAAAPPAQADPSPPPQAASGLSGNTSGAHAIFQPSPEIPSELRRHAMALTVIVHFTVAADGAATAELEEAAPDPQLNQVLLNTFRRWRFFPAMEDGKPVPSTLILKVPVRVE